MMPRRAVPPCCRLLPYEALYLRVLVRAVWQARVGQACQALKAGSQAVRSRQGGGRGAFKRVPVGR